LNLAVDKVVLMSRWYARSFLGMASFKQDFRLWRKSFPCSARGNFRE